MPIVTVELVTDGENVLERDVAQSLANAIGKVLHSPPGHTWLRLRSLRRDEYAENESSVSGTDLPVFVTVLERQPPAGSELETEVTALTQAIAQAIARPAGCVHIEYALAGAGRISFGGKLVR